MVKSSRCHVSLPMRRWNWKAKELVCMKCAAVTTVFVAAATLLHGRCELRKEIRPSREGKGSQALAWIVPNEGPTPALSDRVKSSQDFTFAPPLQRRGFWWRPD